MAEGRSVLFVDAYDSFSENIAALLRQLLKASITMIHVDSNIFRPVSNISESPVIDINTFVSQYEALVIGPGPGNPLRSSDIGIIPLVWTAAESCAIPILGICLGFQSLCLRYGATVARMPEPCHGHAKEIFHNNQDIFEDAGKVIATNYNSLGVKLPSPLSQSDLSRPSTGGSFQSDYSEVSMTSLDSIFSQNIASFRPSIECENLQPLAWDQSGTLMAVRHTTLPFWGLQFHPESCKSNLACHNVIRNWWLKVLEHNDNATTHRDHSHQAVKVVSPFCGDDGRDSDRPSMLQPIGDVKVLEQELQRLTESTEGIVQYRTHSMVTSCSRSIAAICQSHSSAHATAMLESTKKGRFSIYAMPGPNTLRMEYFRGASTCIVYEGAGPGRQLSTDSINIFQHIQDLVINKKARGGSEDSPFWGGFIGYFSYEMGLQTLDLGGAKKSCSTTQPDLNLLWVDRSIVVDNLEDILYVQSIRKDDSEWITTTLDTLADIPSNDSLPALDYQQLEPILASANHKLPAEDEYKNNILTCQSHLRAGDSYELCLTGESQIEVPKHNEWLLYQYLRIHNPVPYAAYLRLGRTSILSSSPELFLTWNRHGTIDMVPMKGTVKKSPDMTFANASAILSTPKESAENLMIADLIRHDLYSTVGRDQPVDVIKLCEVLEHETVYQLVSHVRAQAPIPEHASAEEKQEKVIHYGHKALKQCIPPGSMTGAPKKRSCEILRELEGRQRGVYSGVLGYMDVGGGGSFSVCIRTAFSHVEEDKDGKQTWRVGAGGAITVLSDVDAEWEEMQTKLNSVLRAFTPEGRL